MELNSWHNIHNTIEITRITNVNCHLLSRGMKMRTCTSHCLKCSHYLHCSAVHVTICATFSQRLLCFSFLSRDRLRLFQWKFWTDTFQSKKVDINGTVGFMSQKLFWPIEFWIKYLLFIQILDTCVGVWCCQKFCHGWMASRPILIAC